MLGYASATVVGCAKESIIDTGSSILMNMTIRDPATGNDYDRYYYVNLPKNYDHTKEYPIML